ncbi:cytochrome b [Thiomicrorhabdus sp. 6S3-12]|uniref:cytochrome b n=1 Tax=Thiomicrorhabdus sp. 6S3-12 TaxID=2819681 RepID=UPI001AAC7775|nr:cytochrome b [Thiomicrorhabdus sp. 6S3-12]MBO1923694.1 cytochrome b [Thiomicrorhabdus sp. 6S3-12]
MQWLNNLERYGLLSIFLHWVMVVLIALAYLSIELEDIFDKGSAGREFMEYSHFVIGLSVLTLVLFRLLVKWLQQSPVLPGDPNSMQTKAAGGVHIGLYLFMVLMPLFGWLIISAEGEQVMIFGSQLPNLIGESHNAAEFFEEVHELVGNLGYFIIGIHALAALWHHYILRDDVLRRMLWK